jgi:hypothetical protein
MTRIKLTLNRLLSLIPTKLPVGLTEFNAWADSIIELGGQYADQDSLRFAIASMVIHLPAGTGSISKNHFVKGLRKSAANQVASQVFQDIKAKQQAVLDQQKAEATAIPQVASGEKPNV